MKILLGQVAHARSGDKGDLSNIGVIAYLPAYYPILLRELTTERVKDYFGPLVLGEVVRYELPNLDALNFLMEQALDGGGTISLRTDAQGKTHAAALLRMNIEVSQNELAIDRETGQGSSLNP
jgi:hypothetical protein